MKDYDRDEPNRFSEEVVRKDSKGYSFVVQAAWASTDSIMLMSREDG